MGRMDEMMRTHAIAIIAPDGARQENVRCSFLPPEVIIPDKAVDVAIGFRIVYTLPNGRTDAYDVHDLQFYPGEDVYILKVRKRAPSERAPSGSVVYNVSGNNARVNIGSLDSSVNIAEVNVRVLFEQMRSTAESISEPTARAQVMESIARMEASSGSSAFVAEYQRFIAVVADHLAVFGPFLPALSQLILQ